MEKSRTNSKISSPGTLLRQIAIAVTLLLALIGNVAAEERSASNKRDSSREQARSLFERGVNFYNSGQFEQALDSFQRAYSLRPNAAVRVNIANCYDRMNRPVEAIFNFERFLAEAEGNTEQRRSVEAAIKKLRRKVCELTIQVTPDGASIQIDSTQTRHAPILNPIPLTAGKHTIEVTHSDYLPERRQIEVQGGRPMEVSFVLRKRNATLMPVTTPVGRPTPGQITVPGKQNAAPIKKEPAMTPKEQPERPGTAWANSPPKEPPAAKVAPASTRDQGTYEGRTARGTAMLASGVVTAGLAIGTVVVGALALSAESDYKDRTADWKNTSLPEDERAQARADANTASYRAKNSALAADVLLAGTGVGAIATLCFLFFWPTPQEEKMTASSLLPVFGPHAIGARFANRF